MKFTRPYALFSILNLANNILQNKNMVVEKAKLSNHSRKIIWGNRNHKHSDLNTANKPPAKEKQKRESKIKLAI
jgi:hypothetical protein